MLESPICGEIDKRCGIATASGSQDASRVFCFLSFFSFFLLTSPSFFSCVVFVARLFNSFIMAHTHTRNDADRQIMNATKAIQRSCGPFEVPLSLFTFEDWGSSNGPYTSHVSRNIARIGSCSLVTISWSACDIHCLREKDNTVRWSLPLRALTDNARSFGGEYMWIASCVLLHVNRNLTRSNFLRFFARNHSESIGPKVFRTFFASAAVSRFFAG